MEDFSGIVNWDNMFKYSEIFQDNTPTKWAFVEDFFYDDFYEKLYETYPKSDQSWETVNSQDKARLGKPWKNNSDGTVAIDDDPNYSEEWNKLLRYFRSEEFNSNLRKFSSVPITGLKHFSYMLLRRGGFQLPHIHNSGPSTLVCMLYFSKNWIKGDPGGTYLTPEEDESLMQFEPYNLNNSMLIFQDGPHAGHGVRYLTKDVERRAVQAYFEEFTEKNGWSGDASKKENVQRELIEL